LTTLKFSGGAFIRRIQLLMHLGLRAGIFKQKKEHLGFQVLLLLSESGFLHLSGNYKHNWI
jgi:hypothetical protein